MAGLRGAVFLTNASGRDVSRNAQIEFTSYVFCAISMLSSFGGGEGGGSGYKLHWSMWKFATRVEVRFRASKVAQSPKGGRCPQDRGKDHPLKVKANGQVLVDLVTELFIIMSCYTFL